MKENSGISLSQLNGIDNHVIASVADNSTSIASHAAFRNDSNPKWTLPKTYMDESDASRVEIILKWILNGESIVNIISGTHKITNITSRLDSMKYNGYLRLLEIDLSIIRSYMTENSWILLEDFKQKHLQDKWICPQCHSILEQGTRKWQCGKCLFWHHEKCSKPKEIKRSVKDPDSTSLFCLACFFVL